MYTYVTFLPMIIVIINIMICVPTPICPDQALTLTPCLALPPPHLPGPLRGRRSASPSVGSCTSALKAGTLTLAQIYLKLGAHKCFAIVIVKLLVNL